MTIRTIRPTISPVIRPGTPGDRELLACLLSGLSDESAYQRFLTGAGRPPPHLLAALLPDGPEGGAQLAFVDGELVAHGLWAALGDADAAELAIVVADRHQRQGIGTALALALAGELSARGIERAEVVTGTGNGAVARMVARLAPTATHETDGPTTTYAFPTPATVVQPVPLASAPQDEQLRRSA